MAVGPTVSSIGSVFGAEKSASATRDASNASIAQQQAALTQQATLSQPYRDIGTAAIPQYEALLGIGPQGSAGIADALAANPEYKFALQQGEEGILNQASAQGGVSGNTLAALDRYNIGEASGLYQGIIGDLRSAVQTGQAAAAGQAQNVGQSASTIGSTLINQGNNIAGIDANLAAALSKSFNQASSNTEQAGLAVASLLAG